MSSPGGAEPTHVRDRNTINETSRSTQHVARHEAAAAYQARRVARTLKLSRNDREDAEHEILLVLLERRRFFDPARGPWTPFAHRIARQAAQSVADSLVAARKLYAVSLSRPAARDGTPRG